MAIFRVPRCERGHVTTAAGVNLGSPDGGWGGINIYVDNGAGLLFLLHTYSIWIGD